MPSTADLAPAVTSCNASRAACVAAISWLRSAARESNSFENAARSLRSLPMYLFASAISAVACLIFALHSSIFALHSSSVPSFSAFSSLLRFRSSSFDSFAISYWRWESFSFSMDACFWSMSVLRIDLSVPTTPPDAADVQPVRVLEKLGDGLHLRIRGSRKRERAQGLCDLLLDLGHRRACGVVALQDLRRLVHGLDGLG